MSDPVYPMRVAVERTGLSPHVIRVWERRYGAVVPSRTETNRRVYSEGDIRRLMMLKRLVEVGHAIGRVASLSDSELQQLLQTGPAKGRTQDISGEPRSTKYHVEAALAACRGLDAEGLEDVLARVEIDLGQHALLNVIGELLGRMGELWRQGELRPFQEHLTSAVVRKILDNSITTGSLAETAPSIVLGTLSGHTHELGSLMAAKAAAMQGWRAIYLGPSLPAEEIVAAALAAEARMVGLSLIYPAGDPKTLSNLERLRQLLPLSVRLVVGGRSASTYTEKSERDIRLVEDLDAFQLELESQMVAH